MFVCQCRPDVAICQLACNSAGQRVISSDFSRRACSRHPSSVVRTVDGFVCRIRKRLAGYLTPDTGRRCVVTTGGRGLQLAVCKGQQFPPPRRSVESDCIAPSSASARASATSGRIALGSRDTLRPFLLILARASGKLSAAGYLL